MMVHLFFFFDLTDLRLINTSISKNIKSYHNFLEYFLTKSIKTFLPVFESNIKLSLICTFACQTLENTPEVKYCTSFEYFAKVKEIGKNRHNKKKY